MTNKTPMQLSGTKQCRCGVTHDGIVMGVEDVLGVWFDCSCGSTLLGVDQDEINRRRGTSEDR